MQAVHSEVSTMKARASWRFDLMSAWSQARGRTEFLVG